jgi:outer membrane protein OmpA-like peptidoglycan-associated protein
LSFPALASFGVSAWSSQTGALFATVVLISTASAAFGRSQLEPRRHQLKGGMRVLEARAGELTGSAGSLNGTRHDLQGAMHRLPGTEIGDRRRPPQRARLTVAFKFDCFSLNLRERRHLAIFARTIDVPAPLHLRVEGHTDAVGHDSYNQTLSTRRAQTVCGELRRLLGRRARCEYSGRGESAPVARNRTPQGLDNPRGRARNRRAEVSFRIGRTR